jgi:phosphate starvation-inducible PhoH-like protein
MIENKEITITKGSAGTGKSWTVFSKALELLANPNNPYKKILILVPTAQIENIGFLPGNVKEKIEANTLSDKYTIIKLLNQSNKNKGSEILNKLMEKGLLEFDCVSFWRGRTIDNTIVCVSESSSLLPEFIFTILTRIGESSKYILSGDPEQSDADDVKNKKKIDGLTAAFSKLKNIDEVGKVIFTEEDDIVRNPIIRKIINAWKEE